MLMESDLYRRLKAEIDGISAIDTHVHVDPLNPLSPDLSEVLLYHNYLHEITGYLAKPLNTHLPPRERVRAAIPLLNQSNRSAHAWMVREILRQVYGFEDKLTLANGDALFDKAEELRRRPGRLQEVCRLAKVCKILVHIPPKPAAEATADSQLFVGLCDIFGIFQAFPLVQSLERLMALTGLDIASPSEFVEAVVSYVKRSAAAGHVGLRVDVSPGCVIRRGSEAEKQTAFERLLTGKPLTTENRQLLHTLALDATALAAAETGMTVQIFFARGTLHNLSFPFAELYLLEALSAYLTAHPQTKFEVYNLAERFTQELCVLAKYRTNCYLAGGWWYCSFPDILDRTFGLRLDMLPASKWTGFFSDAYGVEWIVGKAALVRKELTRTLTRKVADGYLTEEDALATARDVLFETPRRLYGLP